MNKVTLIGNITRNPELSETASGVKICRFTIAVNRNYAGADGERKTDFLNITAWRGLGETVAKYAKKGNKIAVNGSIELRNYEDSQGVKRTAVDIVAQDIEFLTPKTEIADSGDGTPADNLTGKQSLDDDGDIPL